MTDTITNTRDDQVVPPEHAPEVANELSLVVENPFLLAKLLGFTINLLGVKNLHVGDNDFFELAGEVLTRPTVVKMVRATCSEAMLKEFQSSDVQSEQFNLQKDNAQTMIMVLWNHKLTHARFKTLLLAALRKKCERYSQLAEKTAATNVLARRFADLTTLFGLDKTESDILLLAYALHAHVWNHLAYRSCRPGPSRIDRLQTFKAALQLPISICAAALSNTGRLRRYGCLDNDLDFNPELEDFLSGVNREPLSSNYFGRLSEPALPWSMHGHLAKQHGELLKAMIQARDPQRGLNILLHGQPGTGKTSFAISLAAELGLDLYRIKKMDETERWQRGREGNSRFAALAICDNQVEHARSVILVDEADEMLRGNRDIFSAILGGGSITAGDKGALNTILDQLRTPCIWITNTSQQALDPSSRRRFDYSIRFDRLSRGLRREVWKNAIHRYDLGGMISEEVAENMAERFAISAGGIDLALRNCGRLLKQQPATGAAPVDLLEKLLQPHCELLDIPVNTGHIARDYTLEGLNVRGSGGCAPQRVVRAVQAFRARQEAAGPAGPDCPRMNVLLYGPPGTGKTEFVKYLSHTLDCPLHTKPGSDFLNPYVGGTERNIREAFRQAAADRAILFIDEADGMLQSRRHATRNWEVTQVNEILAAMENFDGALVCATNAFENLDSATIRRFTFKLEFDYLDEEGKLLFYQRIFADLRGGQLTQNSGPQTALASEPPTAGAQEPTVSREKLPGPLSDWVKNRLARIDNLAPGDFRTVRQSIYYLENKAVSDETLLAALEQESRAKDQHQPGSRPFGFGGRRRCAGAGDF